MIFDTFMINGHPDGPELDLLECRLLELEDVPNLVHVVVEADVDHQGKAKPYYVTEHADRYAPWKERLRIVRATDLPTVADNPDAWAREHAQREWAAQGMCDVAPDDLVMHGDLDEIPDRLVVMNLPRVGTWALQMVWCSFAVDWVCPAPWRGTVISRARAVTKGFGFMRDQRNMVQAVPYPGGYHLGWLGGNEAAWLKLRSFCHPEIERRISEGLTQDNFLREGWHVDGQKMIPVDVDETWPRYVSEHRCPDAWFRPRDGRQFTEEWFSPESCTALAELARSTEGLPGRVVEIGSWEGRSTVALAEAVDHVEAVDTWLGSPGEISADLAAQRDVYAAFQRNTLGLPVTAHRMDWREYLATTDEPFRFCFIDGLHTYEEVQEQIAAVLPRMTPGGVLCGDDAHHPPVARAVLEAFPDAERAATLWIHRT